MVDKFAIGDGIRGDREGIALYRETADTGYLVLSSQGNSQFKIFKREGDNTFVKTRSFKNVRKTDGLAISSIPLPDFPKGIIACHNDRNKNFVIFDWQYFFDGK